ncbi:hypothetical protein [Puia dinghuensis]|nr:hypothetical protein [Puia dinghuensis]
MNSLIPYLAAHLQLDAHDNMKVTNFEEVLKQSQMRILLNELNLWQNNAAAYERGIEDCEKIIEEIGKEVK